MADVPYAVIRDWVILECKVDGLTTTHAAGWIVRHRRLDVGEPYIGSPLTELDVTSRCARNQAGKLIELCGDPLPMDERLPSSIELMLDRAERAWGQAEETTWKRLA